MSKANLTVDLPGATIEDQWTSESTGNHIVRIRSDDNNHELSYIIGQFQERGYVVNGVDFKRNEVSFAKES